MTDQLAAIDDALQTGAADHGNPLTRELQELALALRADAPEPDARFRQELRGRVEKGFAKPASSRRPRWKRLMTPAFATGLVVLPLVLIVIVAGGSDPSTSGSSGGGGGAVAEDSGGGDSAGSVAPAVATPEAQSRSAGESGPAVDPAGGSATVLDVPPAGGGFAPGQRNRKIERSIGLELEMPVDQMARVAEQVTTVTNRHGGFVLNSSVSTGESAGGDFELRIPSTELRPALRDLGGLADVRTQTQTGRDVTREHVTTKDRLQAARAERRSLLRRLELATTDAEAEAIRHRLDIVAGEISRLRGHMRGLHLRTDYAVVTVSLLPKDGDKGGGAGSFDDSLGDAGDLLVGVAGVIVRVLAVALPLGLIALLGWLASRAFTRRRRESALV